MKKDRIEHIEDINANFLKPIAQVTKWGNIVVGFAVALAHFYIPVRTTFGLIFGSVLAASGSLVMYINDTFTQSNITKPVTTSFTTKKKPSYRDTWTTHSFLGLSIPCIILTAGSCFFSLYTGIPLLTEALALPLSTEVVNGIAIATSLNLGVNTLINLWLRTFDLWQQLRTAPVVDKATPDCGCTQVSLQRRLSRLRKRNNYEPLNEEGVTHYVRNVSAINRQPSKIAGTLTNTLCHSQRTLIRSDVPKQVSTASLQPLCRQ